MKKEKKEKIEKSEQPKKVYKRKPIPDEDLYYDARLDRVSQDCIKCNNMLKIAGESVEKILSYTLSVVGDYLFFPNRAPIIRKFDENGNAVCVLVCGVSYDEDGLIALIPSEIDDNFDIVHFSNIDNEDKISIYVALLGTYKDCDCDFPKFVSKMIELEDEIIE